MVCCRFWMCHSIITQKFVMPALSRQYLSRLGASWVKTRKRKDAIFAFSLRYRYYSLSVRPVAPLLVFVSNDSTNGALVMFVCAPAGFEIRRRMQLKRGRAATATETSGAFVRRVRRKRTPSFCSSFLSLAARLYATQVCPGTCRGSSKAARHKSGGCRIARPQW